MWLGYSRERRVTTDRFRVTPIKSYENRCRCDYYYHSANPDFWAGVGVCVCKDIVRPGSLTRRRLGKSNDSGCQSHGSSIGQLDGVLYLF